MSPTRTLRPPAALRGASGVLEVVLPALVVLGLIAATSWVSGVPTVDRLTVVNGTPYQLNVEVAGSQRGGGFDLGAVAPEGSTRMDEIADQGRLWVFRFSYGGLGAGEVILRRSALERSGWRVTVPAEIGRHVRAHGFTPSSSL
jgi:hypothetical protein